MYMFMIKEYLTVKLMIIMNVSFNDTFIAVRNYLFDLGISALVSGNTCS